MSPNEESLTIADYLLKIKAVQIRPEKPFTWASGLKSPIYCDNRLILSYPDIRDFISSQMAIKIRDKYGKPDLIAGVATGAIGIGVLVANQLNLPFVYVRSSIKEHGKQSRIEGHFKKGAKVVVIEDLVSTGRSSFNAVEALREAGTEVLELFAVFSYGLESAAQLFRENNCIYTPLCTYEILVKQAVKNGYIREKDEERLSEWHRDPQMWSNLVPQGEK